MALHKQEAKKKFYPPNLRLYPNVNDKFLIFYDKESLCFRVTHYSKFSFRGAWGVWGSRPNNTMNVKRNDWTYQIKFDDEISALQFAKNKAESRGMTTAVFLLQMEP